MLRLLTEHKYPVVILTVDIDNRQENRFVLTVGLSNRQHKYGYLCWQSITASTNISLRKNQIIILYEVGWRQIFYMKVTELDEI